MKIFISYTTRDRIVTIDFLIELNKKISDLGHIYIDILHNDSENKQARVTSELKESDIFLLLSTDSVNKSPWTKWEIDTAKSINLHKIEIRADNYNRGFSIDSIRTEILNATKELSKLKGK